MTFEEELSDPTRLAPDDAFAALGNETRIQILRTLGEADGPLSFTELRDRVGIRQGGQFNYHLGQLMGHFVSKSDEGYDLREAGRRVIQAVLSGAVTDAPVLEQRRIERTCHYCDAEIEVRYQQGHVEQFCSDCAGSFEVDDPAQQGYLGCLTLPPAGLQGRTTEEAVRAAWIWQQLKVLAITNGICPSCSAPLEQRVSVCEDHDASDGLCGQCDRRYAAQYHFDCQNCIVDGEGTLSVCLAGDTDLLAFLIEHDLNPVSPTNESEIDRVCDDYEEAIRSIDPFEAQFTFSFDGDALTLTVGDDLSVVDADRTTETI